MKSVICFFLMLFFFFSASQANAKSCAIDFARLEAQIAENLANPPTRAIRVLAEGEYKIKAVNDGQTFRHEYLDNFGVLQPRSTRASVANQITFKNSRGEMHSLTITGSHTEPELLDAITKQVLALPADLLESTRRIEIQSFVRAKDVSAWGYAGRGEIVLHQVGATNGRTLPHEFGHNVAEYVWGRANPFKEWSRAFARDGSTCVSKYAACSFAKTALAEDFADAVQLYLENVIEFRMSFPNRAAVLDTIFRGGGNSIAESPFAPNGVWHTVQREYLKPVSQLRRSVTERTAQDYASEFAVLTVAGLGTAAIVWMPEAGAQFKPRPKPQENPH